MAVMNRLAYGLLLFMGFDMFINEGLFKGAKLIFIDRSLFNEGDQAVVGLRGDFHVAVAAQDQRVHDHPGAAAVCVAGDQGVGDDGGAVPLGAAGAAVCARVRVAALLHQDGAPSAGSDCVS